jgi:hypothetical protein
MKKSLLLFIGFLLAVSAYAQKAKPKAASTATSKSDLYKGLKWRNIGPFRGGRANAIAGSPIDPMVYYVGYTGGGIGKTDDGGTTWKNISDGFFKVGSIGDIAVCETDPNVIYVGTGEHAVRGVMTSYGDGVYKSTDGGKTWKNIGLEKTRHISDVIVHPNNSDIVYVAAQGTVHGANADRGVYKSIDGGTTWKKTLFVDENTGASSLSMDMTNPRILYAATWQHRRYPWKVESGGAGCAVWKSTDAGETWSKIIDGLTKISGVFDQQDKSMQAENFKKMLLTLSDDVRVILIKLADRLHNMRTLEHMSPKSQLKIASETHYVYAPLAHRLGLYAIKTELEDLATKYLEPEKYNFVKNKLQETKSQRNRYIKSFCVPITESLSLEGLKFEIKGTRFIIYINVHIRVECST